MKIGKITIGTRGSKLALVQTEEVKQRLAESCSIDSTQIDIVTIVTTGDRIQDRNLNEIGGKALFIKEIEQALLEGRIDIAVHSLKDMPAQMVDGMVIASVLEREDPRDAFISYDYEGLEELPEKGILGTSSVRRQAQILNIKPYLKVVPFRGNVTTRMEKIKNGMADATILAMAGLKRLGMVEEAVKPIETDVILPAVAQGAIGIECLQSNNRMLEILSKINHSQTEVCVSAERAFLGVLEGNCQTPIGALAKLDGSRLKLDCLIASLDGNEIIKTEREGALSQALEMGIDAGEELKKKGKRFL